MSLLPQEPQVQPAKFKVTGQPDIVVHFNPASLQYTVANNMAPGQGTQNVQYVSQSTAKLTMDLVFDTTHNGQDVRELSDRMAALMRPSGPEGRKVPPRVTFEWGTYRFTGMVEQYRETLDYFSPEGVPLRSGINLTLSDQEQVFENPRDPSRASVDRPSGSSLGGQPTLVPAGNTPGAPNPASVANALGQPRAARAIAEANGSDSLRFAAGAELAVGGGAGGGAGGGVQLQAAAGFSAGAGAGFGIGGGAGAGISGAAGFGIGGGAGVGVGGAAGIGVGGAAGIGVGGAAGSGIGIGAGAGAGAGASTGALASASFGAGSAAGGAFAGLRTEFPATVTLAAGSATLAMGLAGGGISAGLSGGAGSSGGVSAGAAIGIGGQAQAGGSAGMTAQVDVPKGFRASIRFE
jgi:hypothetical protein